MLLVGYFRDQCLAHFSILFSITRWSTIVGLQFFLSADDGKIGNKDPEDLEISPKLCVQRTEKMVRLAMLAKPKFFLYAINFRF